MPKNKIKAFRSEIYTNFGDLEREVERRWNDKVLRKKVDDFFGKKMLEVMAKKPHAVFSRTMGTPNQELKYFLDLSKEVKLEPLILEYDNKFVAKNKDSYHLCRLHFYEQLNGKGFMPFSTVKLVDFNSEEGKFFDMVETICGGKLVDFHHEILYKHFPKIKNKTYNFTKWFNATRKLTEYYYLYYLSLFVCHGVLFENFLIDDEFESDFTMKKFLPSFKKIEKMFGVKPLIYPLLPFENEKNKLWLSYPKSMRKVVDKKIKKKRA